MNTGDIFRVRLAGAGGHGNPLERDPAAVLEDVRNGKLTTAHARAAYGVVISEPDLALDPAATNALRGNRA